MSENPRGTESPLQSTPRVVLSRLGSEFDGSEEHGNDYMTRIPNYIYHIITYCFIYVVYIYIHTHSIYRRMIKYYLHSLDRTLIWRSKPPVAVGGL